MINIYNFTKFTNVSRVKQAVYSLYFTGNIDVSTAVHRKPRKKYRHAVHNILTVFCYASAKKHLGLGVPVDWSGC